MLKAVSYSKKAAEEVKLGSINPLRSITWIDLESPTLTELHSVSKKFKVPVKELKHALDVNERPRIKVAKDYTLIIFSSFTTKRHVPESQKKRIRPLGIIFGNKFIITVHRDMIESIDKIKISSEDFLEAFADGTDGLTIKFLGDINKEVAPILNELDDDIDFLEGAAIREDIVTKEFITRISEVKKLTLALRKSITNNKDVAAAITKLEILKDRHSAEELYVELMQSTDQIESAKERIASALGIYFAYSSSKANNVMKAFTVIASLLLFPMLITGLYGMNVALPIQRHPTAFFTILFLIILAISVMLIHFRSRKFL
tara:strand:+ start:1286 stop:2236 length:951 start_codon:yes stop_codon:yes gene_type:complete